MKTKALHIHNKERILRGMVMLNKKQIYQNNTWLLTRDSKIQTVPNRCYADYKRQNISAKNTMHSKLSIKLDGENKIYNKTNFKQNLSKNPALQR